MTDPLETRPVPTGVPLPNLVVLGQTVRVYVRRSKLLEVIGIETDRSVAYDFYAAAVVIVVVVVDL